MEKIIESHIRNFEDPAQRLGATYVEGEGTYFRIWAPAYESLSIVWLASQARNVTPALRGGPEPQEPRPVPWIPAQGGDDNVRALEKEGDCFTGFFPDIKPGARYWLRTPEGEKFADPASRFQPEDTTGPSQVVAQDFAWTDKAWQGIPPDEWVIYEIHPGTFSDGHDFDGIVADLPRLKALGVTTLEIMPVSQFAGDRNWGYDGVFPHAVQHSYGGPERLKALVDACHAQGLAILLDCVYNHLGPEGNVLFQCGPFVRDKYHTPWGPALNMDGANSDDVRRYFLQTAWQWLTEFHFDGLRLDAVQMIFDNAPVTFLQELSVLAKKASERRGYLLIVTGESDMNDARLVAPVADNGLGLDAHWADDFHHCLHVLLTGEKDGYYADYGGLDQLAKIYRRGVAFEGDYSPFRKRRHGKSYEGVDKKRLIVETQNHDQIGNRLTGDRLIVQAGVEKAKLGAACVLLSPFTPFLFMGEEYGATTPFTYFISHHGDELVEAVRKGRAEEWKDFAWQDEPPDPAGVENFESCVLRDRDGNPAMQAYYRDLIALSKRVRQCELADAAQEGDTIRLTYTGKETLAVILSFSDQPLDVKVPDDSRMVFPASASSTLRPYGVAVFAG